MVAALLSEWISLLPVVSPRHWSDLPRGALDHLLQADLNSECWVTPALVVRVRLGVGADGAD